VKTGTKKTGELSIRQIFLLDFLAILFVLLAPYLNYVQHNDFIFEVVNLAVVGVFITVSAALATLLRFVPSDILRVGILAFLLLLFVDIQLYWFESWIQKLGIGAFVLGRLSWIGRRHLSVFVAAVFGTMVAGTVVLALWDGSVVRDSTARPSAASGNSNLPVYVHIILDEFMGPEGFDTNVASQRAIKNEIQTFFADQGFRLFGRAYSPYYDSHDSIPAFLNMTETSETAQFYWEDGEDYIVAQNRYFEILRSRGYQINVYQSSYMDYCMSSPADIRKCVTYDFLSITSTSLARLGTAEKAQVVVTMYASLATLSDVAFAAYGALRSTLAVLGLALPEWVEWSNRPGPIPVMPVFDELIRGVTTAQGGSMFFAHLLIPHFPYSLDSNCRIRRPLMTWENRSLKRATSTGRANTIASRHARYAAYIPQVRCALMKVQNLLDTLKDRGLYDDATIVIQGDHGSRIVRVEPMLVNQDLLTQQDYTDAFLALYAVKSPEISPGYEPRPASLPQLMRALVQGDMDVPAGPGGGQQPWVFLRNVPSTDLVRVPVPCAADGGQGEGGSPAGGLTLRCTAEVD